MLIIIHHLITITKNFLILREDTTYGINGGVPSPEKKFSINFTKANTKFCLSYIMMPLIVICWLMKKKSLNLRPVIEILAFHLNFCLRIISNGFSNTESREVFLNGNVYDLSAHYSSIEKTDIFTFINI